MLDTDRNGGEHPGAVLRRLRHTAGRRISQQALATLLRTSRAHVARLELHGSPPLTDEQLDRLEKAGDAVRPPFSRNEIAELRQAMRAVGTAAIKQADKAVKDIASGAAQIFPSPSARPVPAGHRPGERRRGVAPAAAPDPFTSFSRPMFLTGISQIVDAAKEDIEHLARQFWTGQRARSSTEPDLIMTYFGRRSLVEEAKDPEKFRDAIRGVLREGGIVEHLIAPAEAESANNLVALVPPMISYLGQAQVQVQEHGREQAGRRYRAHVIPEFSHPLAYGICIAGDRGLLIAPSDAGPAIAARTNDPHDIAALRDLLRPYWKNKEPIIEGAGRRTTESVTGHTAEPSVAQPFERLLTSFEVEEGDRRLVKEGLSILNIPVAIHAWKWRAAELCTAGWIPEDLLKILHAQAWELAVNGLRQLPPAVLDKYSHHRRVGKALKALEEYARGLHVRQAAWGDQLSRHHFWDACPKSALIRFISTGELPRDEIPPACKYVAERDDIEIIITRLITRLRSGRNYHLALIDEPPFPQWFYFGIKAAHMLILIEDGQTSKEATEEAGRAGNNMLNIHIDYAPIAAAFAGWFDEHVLKAAVDPPWQDNHSVADWLEAELEAARRPR